MTMRQVAAIAARARSAGGISSSAHNASHRAARHKTAASGGLGTLVPAAGSVSSAAEIAAHARGKGTLKYTIVLRVHSTHFT
jgi:hypothetical protein